MKNSQSLARDLGARQQINLFQQNLVIAENCLLDLADYIYVHAHLKPMSEVLFFLSRLLMVVQNCEQQEVLPHEEIIAVYRSIRSKVGIDSKENEHRFEGLLDNCKEQLPYIFGTVREVSRLTQGTDTLGLAFNTLLRGKFEAGEGLGTHLTPEEVVRPMTRMALKCVDRGILELWASEGKHPPLFGDITAGTGRFACALLEEMANVTGRIQRSLAKWCHVYDQSRFSLELGRIQFHLAHLTGSIFRISSDSILDEQITKLTGTFGLIATNPPFGTNKYRWSPGLRSVFPSRILEKLRLNHDQDRCDPAEVFLIRNLQLLTEGGVLAIVLPDGVAYGERFKDLLKTFEESYDTRISVLAAVSLPVVTFALGGTVAKTSFLILKRLSGECRQEAPLYVASAHHVGFLKQGNSRAQDPVGNDLEQICEEFLIGVEKAGRFTQPWREMVSLSPKRSLADVSNKLGNGKGGKVKLAEIVELVREFEEERLWRNGKIHVSVTDVDETGLIDLVRASHNRPSTKPLMCRPGDILISCINPRIWRVALIPQKPKVQWTCSPEFGVLRPKKGKNPWVLFVAFLHPVVKEQIAARAHGTSSSRQRVAKDEILQIEIPRNVLKSSIADRIQRTRQDLYLTRHKELLLLQNLIGER